MHLILGYHLHIVEQYAKIISLPHTYSNSRFYDDLLHGSHAVIGHIKRCVRIGPSAVLHAVQPLIQSPSSAKRYVWRSAEVPVLKNDHNKPIGVALRQE